MEDRKILKNEELDKVAGGTNEELEKQINDALNEVVSNPATDKYKNMLGQKPVCDIGPLTIPTDSPILK